MRGTIGSIRDSGLRDMIAFLINIFGRSAFRAVADGAEGLKFMAVRLHNITVVDQDDRRRRTPFFDQGEISPKGIGRDALCKMSGKAVNGIDLFGGFMKACGDIGEEAAFGGKDAIIHVSHELAFRFRKLSGNLIGKR